MKRALWFVCVLALSAMAAGPLRAQNNPFLGTWKLNLSKSKFDGMPAPKSLTRTVAAEGAGATYTFTGEDADGKAIEYSFTSHFDGKDSAGGGAGEERPRGPPAWVFDRGTITKMTRTIWKKGGNAIGMSNTEVSRDGKTTIVKGSGVNPDGKKFSMVSVYEEQ